MQFICFRAHDWVQMWYLIWKVMPLEPILQPPAPPPLPLPLLPESPMQNACRIGRPLENAKTLVRQNLIGIQERKQQKNNDSQNIVRSLITVLQAQPKYSLRFVLCICMLASIYVHVQMCVCICVLVCMYSLYYACIWYIVHAYIRVCIYVRM